MKGAAAAVVWGAVLAAGAGRAEGNERFWFPNFQNRPRLNLNGDAHGEIGDIVLTTPEPHQVGAVWFETGVDVENGFISTFSFTITDVQNGGGEGFAFVLQSTGPYSIGEGDHGFGFAGLGRGLAVEFDVEPTPERGDLDKPHVTIHNSLYEGNLDTHEKDPRMTGVVEDLATYDEDPANSKLERRRTATVEYEPSRGTISVRISHHNKQGAFETKRVVDSAPVGAIRGTFYVGFTASTGVSFARYAVGSWKFQCSSAGDAAATRHDRVCSRGFEGADCAITNEVAERECPRRGACNVCVEDVYNCAWCSVSGGPDKCVVGTVEHLKECSSMALEPLACSAGFSRIWLYMFGLALIVVLVFGFVLYKMLPVRQSFRAISLLVAFVGGSLSGMLISFVISVSLVEISETPFFAIAYGLFFLFQFVVIGAHVLKEEVPRRGVLNPHVVLLLVCDLCVLLAALACFLLDRRFIHWLPEGPKVLFYTVLGATLNFCLVFSLAEIATEIGHRCDGSSSPTIASSFEAKAGGRPRSSIITSQARIALLAAASILSGTFFGFMFGTLRIEEESQYRVALALQQETAYTYPVGALLGGVSAMLYQLIQLPLASDEQIDRILHGGDDL